MKRTIAPLFALLFIASACTQVNVQPSPSPTLGASPIASPTGSPAAGRADLRVVTPENGARAGDDSGANWSVDILVRGGPGGTTTTGQASPSPARSPSPSPASPSPAGTGLVTTTGLCQPAFNAQGTPGRNTAFRGLVVLLSTTPSGDGLQGPRQNLAGLFQIVALDDTERGRLCHAVWHVARGRFGVDVDSQLTAFVVDGDAPDVIPENRSQLRIVSNEVTVRFHINGRRGASPSPGAATGSPRPSPTGSPALSPSPSPTRSP